MSAGGGCQVETSRIISVVITTTEERSCIAIKSHKTETFADWFHACNGASCLSHILKEVFFFSHLKMIVEDAKSNVGKLISALGAVTAVGPDVGNYLQI